MSKHKKPYSKPEVTISPVGSPKRNEIIPLLVTKGTKVKNQKSIPPPAKPR